MTYTTLLKNIWNSIYDPNIDVNETMEKFFHSDYEQCINGILLKRKDYIHHVCEQKKNMTIDAIDYKHVLEKENELFAIYYPRGRNTKNLPVEGEVIAYFHFENHKLLKIHGQVRLLKGDLADVDMKNSRTSIAS